MRIQGKESGTHAVASVILFADTKAEAAALGRIAARIGTLRCCLHLNFDDDTDGVSLELPVASRSGQTEESES